MKKIFGMLVILAALANTVTAGIKVQQSFHHTSKELPGKVWEKIASLNSEVAQPLGIGVSNNKIAAANKARRDLKKVCECQGPAHIDYVVVSKTEVYAVAYIFPLKGK